MCKAHKQIRAWLLGAIVLLPAVGTGTAWAQPEIPSLECELATPIPMDAVSWFSLLPPNEIPEPPPFDLTPCGLGDPSPAGGWFSVTGTGNTVTISTCELSSPGSANFDTQISVYCRGCDLGVCVAGNDDVPDCDFHSTVEFCTQPAQEYLVYVSGYQNDYGDFALSASDDGIPCTADVDCATPTGACCVETCLNPPQADCLETTEAECLDLAGQYLGDAVACVGEGQTHIYSSTPSLTIPDGDQAGVVAIIEIPEEDSCVIYDVDVELQITHSWIGDLSIDLFSPEPMPPYPVPLWYHQCDSMNNINAVFDDEGVPLVFCSDASSGEVIIPANCSCPPSHPSVCPDGPGCADYYVPWLPVWEEGPTLTSLEGQQSGGVWALHLKDTTEADEGTLDYFALHLTCGVPACAAYGLCPVDDDGKVTLCHVPPGDPGNAHTIRVGPEAAASHLLHGDSCGPCADGGTGGDTSPGAHTVGVEGQVREFDIRR